MPSNTGLTRQSPGPLPGQQPPPPGGGPGQGPGQANGMGTGLPNGLAHAGHQTDINYLWGLVQDLSDALTRNREQTAAIVARVQNAGANSTQPAGRPRETNGEEHSSNTAAELASLRSQLHQSQTALAESQAEASALAAINDDYVTFLHGAMEKLRAYGHAHATALVSAQAHYGGLLEQERAANVALRVEHGEWQRGLGRAAEHARAALRARTDEVSGLERGMREARAENAVLRRLLGWGPAAGVAEHDDSDGDDGGMGVVGGGVGRGTHLATA